MLHRGPISSAILEFKRFMGLAALGYRGLAVPNEDVDNVWHTFLLFTREYALFCRKAVGAFVHHVPTKSGRKATNALALPGLIDAYSVEYLRRRTLRYLYNVSCGFDDKRALVAQVFVLDRVLTASLNFFID